MREHLLAMREIWTHDEAEFHGEHVDFDPIWMWPKADPPILVGGHGPRLLRMLAELGDGWLPTVDTEEEFERDLSLFTEAFDEVGKPPVEVTAVVGPDERLLERCAEHGVRRCVILPPQLGERVGLESFLDEYSRLIEWFR
jgi:alkanesulfonate monooxygenase SsuD/methylene tetrahydromethanopterin reductase-like flavin-dependent oxidoreductase (luciferase family)